MTLPAWLIDQASNLDDEELQKLRERVDDLS